jgi:F-type H+-transporting ATPase subunit b
MDVNLASIMAASGGGGLGINLVAFLSQLFSFGVVFLILWRWGFPAITGVLDKRTEVIQEGIENAEKAKRDLAEAHTNAEQILAEARREAQATIERAKNTATQEANRIREDANKDAERISEQQIARVHQEANRARNELSRLVVNLSIDAAGRVIERSVDTNDNRRLVEEFVTASNSNQTRAS